MTEVFDPPSWPRIETVLGKYNYDVLIQLVVIIIRITIYQRARTIRAVASML
jgi:hypothetical protein